MVSNNFYAVLAGYLTRAKIPFVAYNGTARETHEGGVSTISLANSNTSAPYIGRLLSTSNGNGVWIGTGTTPAKATDYKLSGEKITSFSAIAGEVVKECNDDGSVTLSCTFTITNTGNADFTIGEVGLFGSVTYAASSTTYVMYDRTVLDEPITIPTGGVGQLTYSITLKSLVATA